MSGWIAETLAASAVLMAVVLALRAPVTRMFGARVAYALWLLPALRMVLPPLPGLRRLVVPALVVRLPDAAHPAKMAVGLIRPELVADGRIDLPGLSALIHLPAASARPGVNLPAMVDLAPLAIPLWLLGAAVLFGWQLWRYRRFVTRAVIDATPIGQAAGTAILLSDAVGGPVATGIWRRRILLPRDFARRYTRDQQRLVLDHEAAHHDRGDLAANLAALAMLAAHWWNPLAWAAHRAFRADQELACDASVLARLGSGEREAYARAVACSAGFATPAAAAPLSPVAELKRRLKTMNRPASGPLRTAAGAVLIAAVLAAGLTASASGGQETVVAAAPAAPVPPPPPVAPAAPPPPEAPVAPIPHALVAPPASPAEASAEAARAQAEAARAAIAANRAATAAQQAVAGIDMAALVRTSMAAAREGLVAGCRARGGTVRAGDDIGTLAQCNTAGVQAELRTGLKDARDEIVADPDFDSKEAGPALHAAVAEIDRQRAMLPPSR